MVDIRLDLPADRSEGGIGKINEDINKLKTASATTADLTSQALNDITSLVQSLQATVTANSADITTLKGGTVTAPVGTPDLVITAIKLYPTLPVAGNAVAFTATVKNIGTGDWPAGKSIYAQFVVDGDVTTRTTSATSLLGLKVNDTIDLASGGGANNGNAYLAEQGSHNVKATVNDIVSGAASSSTTVDNNSLTVAFSVGGVTTGGSTTTPPAGSVTYNSDGLAATALTIANSSINDATAVQVSATFAYDPNRTTTQTLEYGFSVRQVDTSGTIISPDDASLDMSLQAFQSTSTWTNKLTTITGSRTYSAGRYSVTPFYRLQGTSTYVKLSGLTKYFDVAASPVTTPTPDPTTGSTPGTVTGAWISGSSGEVTANGKFGTWRGYPDQGASHWAQDSTTFPALSAGNEYGNWTGSMTIAIGGTNGQSWANAASGSLDSFWTSQLNGLKSQWTRIQRGTLFISFAHELNGSWYPWKVLAGQEASAAAAIKRFANLKKSIFPAAKLGIVLNRESTNSGMDWRKIIPGYTEGTTATAWLDFLGVDWYNQNPTLTSSSQWADISTQTDGTGAPKGIEAHRKFALKMGVPLGVQEWGGNADNGDYADYIQCMFDFFKANAGAGAGNVVFENYFNTLVPDQSYRFFLYNDGRATRMPVSAAKYKSLWSSLK